MHVPLQKTESEALLRSQDGPKTPKMASKSHLKSSQNTQQMIQTIDQTINYSFWTIFEAILDPKTVSKIAQKCPNNGSKHNILLVDFWATIGTQNGPKSQGPGARAPLLGGVIF